MIPARNITAAIIHSDLLRTISTLFCLKFKPFRVWFIISSSSIGAEGVGNGFSKNSELHKHRLDSNESYTVSYGGDYHDTQ